MPIRMPVLYQLSFLNPKTSIWLGNLSNHSLLSNSPCRLKKRISPCWSQNQNSFAPASKYGLFFLSISSTVLDADLISMTISGDSGSSETSYLYLLLNSALPQATSATLVPSSVWIPHSEKTLSPSPRRSNHIAMRA